jgi:phage terminase large subunit GpA-like protein
MLADGEWRPDGAPSSSRGYAISALYSPWVRWREIAAEWIRVRADRDLRGQQEWTNLRLGEVWLEEENRITVESLEKNREGYEAELPEGALVLTCGVDVQDARLEAEIVGWGVGRESWGVEYAIIGGDTSDVSPAGPWARLTELLARSWKRADGSALAIFCTCIDSGGHRTDEVYRFCYGLSNVRAIKGRSRTGYPIIVLKPSVIDGKYLLHNVGVDGAKDVLFSRLGLEAEGPGYCHFPTERSTGYDDTYFRGLISERKKKVVRAGRVTTTWVQTFSRNEPLDCRVYATAALELAVESGLDLAALAAADDRRVASPSEGTATARDRPVPSSVPRRRVYSRGVG